jgi:hypothetical protein
MSTQRQKAALNRLESQLKSGQKTVKGSATEKQPLTEKDVSRITREITTLKKLSA